MVVHKVVYRRCGGWAAQCRCVVVHGGSRNRTMLRVVHGGMDHAGRSRHSRGVQRPQAKRAGQQKQAAQNWPTKEKKAPHDLNIPLGGIYGKENGLVRMCRDRRISMFCPVCLTVGMEPQEHEPDY